jgi:hypothetical protein
MGFMLAAASARSLEFFAQAHQKTLDAATCETRTQPMHRRKKARREAGLKSKETLKNLKINGGKQSRRVN